MINAAVFTLYVFLVWFFAHRFIITLTKKHSDKLDEVIKNYEEKRKEDKSQMAEFRSDLEKARKDAQRSRAYYLRLRLLLLARLSGLFQGA